LVLLDAYALVALVAGGPAEAQVRLLLRAGDCSVATLNLAEVFDVLVRVRGVPGERARAAIEPLLEGVLGTVPLTALLARRAAALRLAHYHRIRRPLSLADCVLLASAGEGDQIATADAHVLAVAPEEGIKPIPLPEEGD
jgi:predicted nucleic acid-binding protein